MSNLEWATFLTALGFIGFGLVTLWACVRAVNAPVKDGEVVICFGNFIAMFVLTSTVILFVRPPFSAISISTATQINAGLVWGIFVVTAVAVVKRA